MAIDNNRNLLEQQILSNSGLKGKELENLKARLATLSEQQLQAELSKLLSGNNKGEWYTGITLEHSESVVIKSNHETKTFTDENGNEISELRGGDEVFERTIKSTDENGNVYITTVTFQSGKPLTQTKTKNGNTIETTTYRYNDDADVPFVTVETKKADQSKVMTNVLEIDENGNFDNEDFIDRQTTSIDGTTTHIFTENNCVIEQQVKPNGKKVDTLYKGDSIEDYDNKKLHRVYQRTELNGEVHEVAYDGNGNTRTVVQNGESPSVIAKKFGVKESSLLKLNPARGKNAITQVGADIVVPGEYNADSRVMKTRKTKQGAMQDYANDEVQRTVERLYSSTMQEVTLDKDYKDAYSYARALLVADGIKNPSNQQVNNKANEILVANGNIKFTKGTKVQIAAKTTNSKLVQDLSNNGFKPTRENAIFYNKFNALNPSQQQNVLSVIKYCRSQKITDPNKIKARILETFPDINLFDSGKLIPMNSSFGTPVFQRKNPVALETFLTDTLKLDLKSETGKMVYERLSSLPQDELNKIDGHNFADMSKANFNEIANSFETSGVNIRTQMEYEMEVNRRNQQAERLGISQQKFTSEMLANIYDNAADMLEQYYHNHGVFDAGTYLEGMKNLMDLVTPDNIFGIDMRSTLHVASDCRKAAQRFRQMHTDNPETFKREYAQLKKDGLVTSDYNQQNVQEFMDLIQSGEVDINSDKFKNACQKAFGFKGVENTEKYIQTGEMAGNIGDIVIMLYTLGAASELKMMGKATTGVYGALERGAGKIMGKTAAQKTAKVGTSMLMGGTTLGGFTLGKETLNNLSNPMRDATSWETWKQTGIASAESFGFGFAGGLLNETVVAPIVKAIEKPVTKATQAVSKALTEQGELTGKQIMETVSESGSLKLDGLFKMNSQEWVNLARTATAKGVGFGVEVTGFTAYEAGLDTIKDLIDPQTGRLPDNITVESLTDYLLEKGGEQLSNLGTIKGISQLLMMSKGGKVAQKAMMNEILSKSETLKDIKFKKAEINGHEVYEVTYPNGNRAIVSSPEQAIATCQMAMQMEFLAKSLTDGEHKSEIARPQGMNAEEDAPIQKAHKENPAMILDEAPQVKKSEATEGMPKENMNTSSVEHATHASMSDAEFEALKSQLLENPNFPKSEDKSGYFRHKKFTRIDKDNILFAKELLENSELTNILDEKTLSKLINNFGTNKNEASRILLQKLKNNPDLLKNSCISEKIGDILSGVNSIKSLELVDKLFSKPETLENLINIDKILSVADNDYSISFAKKILENPKLFQTLNFILYLPDLIKKCDSDITNNTKLELFNEFIKNPQNISDAELTNAFARAMHIGNNKVFDLRNKDNKLSSSELKTLELNSEKSLRSDLYENLFLELSKNEKFKDISSKYYDLYLENEFKECSREDATRYREMCKSIDKEYGVKVILPANLKEVGQSLILVYQELNNYKMHSNNHAKMPPVLDFMAPLDDRAAGQAWIRDGVNNIDIKELSVSFIKHALRHEMAHINDTKQLDKFPTEIRTFKNEPKKDTWTGELIFDVHSDLDINNCKFVEELRNAGISEKLIEYAYSNPLEFIAVSSQGDFSKYSPEFKKYLTELGMPEWMLSFSNPKPYFISRENKAVKTDEANLSENSQKLNAEVNRSKNPAIILEDTEQVKKSETSEVGEKGVENYKGAHPVESSQKQSRRKLKELEGGVLDSELTEVAPFARHLEPHSVIDPFKILAEDLNERANKANFDLAKYEETGFSLKYSKQEFTKRLKDLVNNMPIEAQREILKKFNIELNYTGDGFELRDIPKIPEDVKTPLELAIKAEIERFTKENEIEIDNPEVKVFLDDFIKIVPEFLFIVGKKQHETHAYTVDVHTIKVLQNAIEHPEYKNLSSEDKMVLNTAILLHDIAKQFVDIKTPDEEHAQSGYKYAIKILDRFNLSSDIKQRIVKLIGNHEFFKTYNERYIPFKAEAEENEQGRQNAEKYGYPFAPRNNYTPYFNMQVEYNAGQLLNTSDFKLAKILTYSDLKSVNPDKTFTREEWNKKGEIVPVEYKGFEKFVTGTHSDAEFKEYIDKSLSYIEKELQKYDGGKIEDEFVYETELVETSIKLFGCNNFFESIHRKLGQNQPYAVHRSDFNMIIQARQALIDAGVKEKEVGNRLRELFKRKDSMFSPELTSEFIKTYLDNKEFIDSHNINLDGSCRGDLRNANMLKKEIAHIKEKESISEIFKKYNVKDKWMRERLVNSLYTKEYNREIDKFEPVFCKEAQDAMIKLFEMKKFTPEEISSIVRNSFSKKNHRGIFQENDNSDSCFNKQIFDTILELSKEEPLEDAIEDTHLCFVNPTPESGWVLAPEILSAIKELNKIGIKDKGFIGSTFDIKYKDGKKCYDPERILESITKNERYERAIKYSKLGFDSGEVSSIINASEIENGKVIYSEYVQDKIANLVKLGVYPSCSHIGEILYDRQMHENSFFKVETEKFNETNYNFIVSMLNKGIPSKILDNMVYQSGCKTYEAEKAAPDKMVETGKFSKTQVEAMVDFFKEIGFDKADGFITDDIYRDLPECFMDIVELTPQELDGMCVYSSYFDRMVPMSKMSAGMAPFRIVNKEKFNQALDYYKKGVSISNLKYLTQNPELYKELKNEKDLSFIKTKNDADLVSTFWKIKDVKSINELSKQERIQLMNELMMHKSGIEGNNVSEKISILPKDSQGYSDIMKNITGSFGLNSEPYTQQKVLQINKSFSDLSVRLQAIKPSEIETDTSINQLINEISSIVPNLNKQNISSILLTLQRVVKNPEYKTFSESDKKLLNIAVMFSKVDSTSNNPFDSAIDACVFAKQMGLSDTDAMKIFTIVKNSNLTETIMNTQRNVKTNRSRSYIHIVTDDIKETFETAAMELKDYNNFQMAKLLYTANEDFVSPQMLQEYAPELYNEFLNIRNSVQLENGEVSKNAKAMQIMLNNPKYTDKLEEIKLKGRDKYSLSRNLNKLLEEQIDEIKSSDVLLPQTNLSDFIKKQSPEWIQEHTRNVNGRNVLVISSDEIPDFYMLSHTTQAFNISGKADATTNMSNFENFAMLFNDKTICLSYSGDGKIAVVGNVGLLIQTPNTSQYIARGTDISSVAKDIPTMISEYISHRSQIVQKGRFQTKATKDYDRNFFASLVKEELSSGYRALLDQKILLEEQIREYSSETTTESLESLQQQLRYVKNQMRPIDKIYRTRIENLINKANGEIIDLEFIRNNDPELGVIYDKILNTINVEHRGNDGIMRTEYHNEVLGSNTKPVGLFVRGDKELFNLTDDYLRKAEEGVLPIVIFK